MQSQVPRASRTKRSLGRAHLRRLIKQSTTPFKKKSDLLESERSYRRATPLNTTASTRSMRVGRESALATVVRGLKKKKKKKQEQTPAKQTKKKKNPRATLCSQKTLSRVRLGGSGQINGNSVASSEGTAVKTTRTGLPSTESRRQGMITGKKRQETDFIRSAATTRERDND